MKSMQFIILVIGLLQILNFRKSLLGHDKNDPPGCKKLGERHCGNGSPCCQAFLCVMGRPSSVCIKKGVQSFVPEARNVTLPKHIIYTVKLNHTHHNGTHKHKLQHHKNQHTHKNAQHNKLKNNKFHHHHNITSHNTTKAHKHKLVKKNKQ